ncbi:MAG TPA: PQQ-binding-like beta-propeller repeat protein [Polyangium sp.]|nr:PQQ-binding-like beta-propeller repeat protein [Polyangium sp.]
MFGHKLTPAILGSVLAFLGTGCFANYTVIYNDGQAAMRSGQLPKADELFASIPATADNYADALAGRANVASTQGQYPKAVEFWKQAAKVSPGSYRKEKNREYHRDYAKLLIASQLEIPGSPRGLFGVDNILVAHTRQNTLVAFDVDSKKQAWSRPLDKTTEAEWSRRVFATGAIIGLDEVKTAERPTRLVAIEAKTGAERWVQPLYPIGSEMMITANETYVFISNRIRGSQNYEINTFDAKTGKPKWARPIDGRSGPITASKGGIFAWTSNNSILGLNAENGDPLFSLPMAIEHNQDQLVTDDRRVFLIGKDKTAYAFDASDKKYDPPTKRILWTSPIDANCGGPTSVAAVLDGKLIVPCAESVYALDAETGKQHWKRDLAQNMGNGSKVAPTLLGGLIAIKYGTNLVTLAPVNGEIRWIFDSDGKNNLTDALPIEFRDHIVVGASDGNDKFLTLSLTPAPAVPY